MRRVATLMGTDEHIGHAEVQLLRSAHVPVHAYMPDQTVVDVHGIPVAIDPLEPIDPMLVAPIKVHTSIICRECWQETHLIEVASWPCLASRLLRRDAELTQLVRALWPHARRALHPALRALYGRLGLDQQEEHH